MQSAETIIRVEKSALVDDVGARKRYYLGPAVALSACIVIFFAVGVFRAVESTLGPSDLSRIVNEAAGTVPIAESDNDAAKVLRDFFREVITARRQAELTIQRDNATPEMAQLLQAKSVSSLRVVQQTLTQLQELRQVDIQLAAAWSDAKEHLDESILQLSRSRYAPFLHGCEEGLGRTADLEISLISKDREYIEAAIDLYNLAEQNSNVLSVRGDHIYIADSGVRYQYNAKLSNVRRLANELDVLSAEEAAKRKSAMDEAKEKLHLSPSDLDIFDLK